MCVAVCYQYVVDNVYMYAILRDLGVRGSSSNGRSFRSCSNRGRGFIDIDHGDILCCVRADVHAHACVATTHVQM